MKSLEKDRESFVDQQLAEDLETQEYLVGIHLHVFLTARLCAFSTAEETAI